jgi:hypothetical protein
MNNQEKGLYRLIYKNRILTSNGKSFEDLFTNIMSYVDSDFEQIKAWGNLGDGKNDGFIPSKGIYYQVFSPEDIRKSYPTLIAKLNADLKGLFLEWNPINEFYFVVNDKFLGVEKESKKELIRLKEEYSLKHCDFITSSDLERILFELDDDIIYAILNFLPNIEAFQSVIKNHTTNISKPLLTFSNYIISKLEQPRSVDDLWFEYERDTKNDSYLNTHITEDLIFSLAILFSADLITENNGLIYKCN